MRSLVFLAAGLAVALAAGACGDDALECVEVSTECTPTHQPTFDNVYSRILEPSCGVTGSACHAREGGKGGLTFADADEAYRMLVDQGRVIPGDPQCSELGIRISTTDPRILMPPGNRLSEGDRCTILRWIEAGAPR